MKSTSIHLSVAALCCMLSASVYAQTPDATQPASTPASASSSGQDSPAPTIAPGADAQAKHMVTARAELVSKLDAAKDVVGSTFQARLSGKVHLDSGVEIPKGSVLMGQVAEDDLKVGGTSRLSLRFTSAHLKDGTTVPVQVTIVALYPAALDGSNSLDNSDIDWTPTALVLDRVDVLSGVDLHSRIGGVNSGTLVSSTKNDMKLGAGTQFGLAIGPVQPVTPAATTQGMR